jgi:deoxyribonuclease-4
MQASSIRRRSAAVSIAGPPEQTPYQIAVGAQVSAAGGPFLAVERAAAMGATVLQLFVDQNRRFPRAPLSQENLERLRVALVERGMPAYVHVPYLCNVATPDAMLRERSLDMVARALEASAISGLRGVVVHPGSHLGRGFAAVRAHLTAGLGAAWSRAGVDVPLLIENTAGGGGHIGATLGELRALLDDLDAAGVRAGLCIDTQHAHAAGADLASDRGVAAFARELRELDLARRVALVHANDSGSARGSRRDLHANPGQGTIGASGFRALARLPELARVPWVLEVPGLERSGPRREEIEALRRILEEPGSGTGRRAEAFSARAISLPRSRRPSAERRPR